MAGLSGVRSGWVAWTGSVRRYRGVRGGLSARSPHQAGRLRLSSQHHRRMLYAMFASVTVAVARAMPTVRITRPIGPFWWAKGCSTWARTADFLALARAVRLG